MFDKIIIILFLIYFIIKINKSYNIEKFMNKCDFNLRNNQCDNIFIKNKDKYLLIDNNKLIQSTIKGTNFFLSYNNNKNNIFIIYRNDEKVKYLELNNNKLELTEKASINSEFYYDIINENKIIIYINNQYLLLNDDDTITLTTKDKATILDLY